MIASSRGIGEGDLLLAVLAGRVGRDVAHRTRPVERYERDQVLELRRLDETQGLAHAGGLELEDPRRLAAGEHCVRRPVVERERADVDSADELHGLVDHVQVAQAEKVHLQKSQLDDVVHPELGHDLLVGALLLQRDELDQRLRADHDARCVDRVRAGEPFEGLREVDDLLRDRVRVDRLSQLRAGAKRLGERLPGTFRDELRDAVDDAVGDVEHPPRVAYRRSGSHRREGDDLGDPVTSVLLGDVVDDLVAPGDREVDVHVGQVLARRVQEPLEKQPVAHRVDVGDLEAVRGERAGGGAAPGADADPVLLGEVDEVPDDEEVVGKAHLPNRLQLEAKPLVELRRRLAESLEQSLLAQLDQVVEGVTPLRHRVLRQQDLSELDLDRAALCHLERARERMLVPDEVARHLLGRLEEELVRVEAPVRRVLQRVAGLDAEERLVRVGVVRIEIVDVAGRDEREARLLG